MAGERIALITNYMVAEYFSYIYSGVNRVTKENKQKLICIPVGDFDHPDKENNKRPEIFKLVSKELFDGLIINEGPFFNNKPSENFPEIIAQFYSLPGVGLGTKFSQFPHICLDNEGGIDLVFSHLVTHGCKKIAFISGPELNKDSQERTIAYLKNVKNHAMNIPNHFIQHTDFYPAYVEENINILLSDKNNIPDAIVCGNDVIADSTIIRLREIGMRVPEDIKVTGFDNSSYALENEITTVSIQHQEQGMEAARTLTSILKNKQAKLYTKIPARLVCRKSCGCNEENPFGNFENSYYKQIAAEKQIALNIHRTGQNLNAAKTMQELREQLEISLAWIGVRNCAIYLLPSANEKGQLYFTDGSLKSIGSKGDIPSCNDFVSHIFDSIPGGDTCILLPLYSKNMFHGLFVVYQPQHDLVLYENLSLQISEAIHTVRQMETIQDQLAGMKKSLNEKELLLKEIHHRVKNNLQVISSLINLKTRNREEHSFENIITDLRASISSIALVHETIYQQSNLDNIVLGKYFRSLFSTLYQINPFIQKVHVQINGENIRMDLQKAINLGLVFSELCLNTFKHAYPDSGNPPEKEKKIKIDISEDKDSIFRMAYMDNGSGYKPNTTEKPGFGLTIIRTLVEEQMSGVFTDSSHPDKGASYKIEIDNKL